MENYQNLLTKQRNYFRSGETKTVAFRINTLNKLKSLIQKHQQDILDAVKQDLNKSEAEAQQAEINLVIGEINFMIENIEEWAATKEVPTPDYYQGAKSFIQPEPYGSALVIAPWNYPFQLAMTPLVGAVAGGNTVVLKPSELTPKTSVLLSNLINENFPEAYLHVVEGEVETSTALLKEDFDYIFFTGSTGVGKIVAQAAANNLTPMTLELGGKSPTIVHKDANLEEAAKRIARGKFMNAGQTCVAPDYLLVHSSVKDELMTKFKEVLTASYGENIVENPNYGHVVSNRHFDRLVGFLENKSIVFGGKHNRDNLIIEPTIIDNISWNDDIMQDEIFGPILPVMTYDSLDEIIDPIVKRPKPLALYVFSEDEAVQEEILSTISFGGGSINDTISHMTSHFLPFGGVGASGLGAYHGKASFDTFSHFKSVLKRSNK